MFETKKRPPPSKQFYKTCKKIELPPGVLINIQTIMKKILNFSVLILAFLALALNSASAQKYGHLNSGNLLEELPEVQAADKQLAEYREELVAEGEKMAQAFQTKAQAFMQKVQAGELTPVEQQKQEQQLQAERQKIMEYEQTISQKVSQRRQELLDPILQKVQDAIDAVGEENGYVMIFDTSIFNAVLFAKDSDNVMPLVKAKLGL